MIQHQINTEQPPSNNVQLHTVLTAYIRDSLLFHIFLHEFLVEFRSEGVVDESSAFLLLFTLGAVLEHNIIVPSETQMHGSTCVLLSALWRQGQQLWFR